MLYQFPSDIFVIFFFFFIFFSPFISCLVVQPISSPFSCFVIPFKIFFPLLFSLACCPLDFSTHSFLHSYDFLSPMSSSYQCFHLSQLFLTPTSFSPLISFFVPIFSTFLFSLIFLLLSLSLPPFFVFFSLF